MIHITWCVCVGGGIMTCTVPHLLSLSTNIITPPTSFVQIAMQGACRRASPKTIAPDGPDPHTGTSHPPANVSDEDTPSSRVISRTSISCSVPLCWNARAVRSADCLAARSPAQEIRAERDRSVQCAFNRRKATPTHPRRADALRHVYSE